MASNEKPKATATTATKRYRATVRTRLALTYSGLLTASGVVMLTIVYMFMRFVPTYDLQPSVSMPTEDLAQLPPTAEELAGATSAATITAPANELRITSTDEMLNLLLVASIIVLVMLAVAGIAVGWAVAGRMLRPLHDINGAVRQATQGDLKHRINLVGPKDEISELASNFDEMLTQLERSFTATKHFAANASHELLTPIATSRAMLDLAIAQRDAPEDREVFERLRLMNERSIETAQALLKLAQIEATTDSPQQIETVDLAETATGVVSFCAPEAAERGVVVRLDTEAAKFEGDPVLARQLVTNLVQNAIRHNALAGGSVTVTTRAISPSGGARLTVENDGPILEPGKVDALMEPFTRAQGRSSVSSAQGHGLGLSIVAAIVRRFEGKLELEAREEGSLRVVVTLP